MAYLTGANLTLADLFQADLSGATLLWVTGTTPQQLGAAYSLHGTTLPDGSKHS